MVGAGIEADALLIVDYSILPDNGDIVLALINAEMTVKRFFKENNQILLAPENPEYPSIIINKEDHFAICGVVVQVVPKDEEFLAVTELINTRKYE